MYNRGRAHIKPLGSFPRYLWTMVFHRSFAFPYNRRMKETKRKACHGQHGLSSEPRHIHLATVFLPLKQCHKPETFVFKTFDTFWYFFTKYHLIKYSPVLPFLWKRSFGDKVWELSWLEQERSITFDYVNSSSKQYYEALMIWISFRINKNCRKKHTAL